MIRNTAPDTGSLYTTIPSPPSERPLRLSMVAWIVAGIRTHYENVVRVARETPDVVLTPVEIDPWHDDGRIEKLSILPKRARGSLRTYLSTVPLYRQPLPDVVWTQTITPITPYLATRARWRRVPVVCDADSTPHLLASFGEHYADQVAGPPTKRRMVDAVFGAGARSCARVVCWSEWAARSFVDVYGVRREQIRILPPGVDVIAWERPNGERVESERVRLLFVGADFVRKGGDLLLDVWRGHFRESCDLHLVTREPIAEEPGLYVHSNLTPNDPRLLGLYHTSDALVLPTRSDCFSLASIEALAAGLPVITTPVGGIPEIIADGVTGLLVRPDDGEALRAAIEALTADASRRERMGMAGRMVAVGRFSAERNAGRLLDLLREAARQRYA
ncbi:MAG TPA: glycosyltransferase family 4 protein [Ktedonobacterales bacterium]|nr:glycosyltransferase family 4 protein [Ktedonobacterales bacterium]